jgi:hypothetical protein
MDVWHDPPEEGQMSVRQIVKLKAPLTLPSPDWAKPREPAQ